MPETRSKVRVDSTGSKSRVFSERSDPNITIESGISSFERTTKTPRSPPQKGLSEEVAHTSSLNKGEIVIDTAPTDLLDTVFIDNNKIEKTGKFVKMENIAPDRVMVVRSILRDIPIFTGTRDASLEQTLNNFLTEVKDACDFIEKEEEQLLLSKITSRIRGDAINVVNGARFKQYEELESLLYKHYLPRRDPYEAIRQINTIKQTPTEDILTFSERLKSLVSLAHNLIDQAYPNSDQSNYKKDISKQAIRAFKFGIKDHAVQTALFHENNKTLDAAIEDAIKWDGIEKARYEKLQPNPIDSTPNIEKLLSTLMQKLEQPTQNKHEVTMEREINAKKINSTGNTPYCEFCRRKGHEIADCRTKLNAQFCNFCYKYYHNYENCPKRKNSNGQNQQRFFPRPFQGPHNNFNQQNKQTFRPYYGQSPTGQPITQQVQPKQQYPNQHQHSNRFYTKPQNQQYNVGMLQQSEYYGNGETNIHFGNQQQPNQYYPQEKIFNNWSNGQYQSGNETGAVCSQQIDNPK